MFPYKVITDFNQAEEYRENLSLEGEEYLKKVDKLVSGFSNGEAVNLDKIVKPSNFENFWLAFSYVLLAIGREISLSDDFLTVRLLSPAPDRSVFIIAG